MKYNNVLALLITFGGLNIFAENEPFQVIIEPKWEELDADQAACCRFGGKWVLAGSIVFKKKANEAVMLDKLILSWNGTKIDQLYGSLYVKEYTEPFLPINDYLVCDSSWNRAQQKLVFKFNEQHTLGPTNTFYLVLTIERDFLPEQYKESNSPAKLALTMRKKTLVAYGPKKLPSHGRR
jgi:hypothetical protein